MDPEVHYHIQECPQLGPILGHTNFVYTLNNFFFKIHFNIVLSYDFLCVIILLVFAEEKNFEASHLTNILPAHNLLLAPYV
jgi:hypothetical protein